MILSWKLPTSKFLNVNFKRKFCGWWNDLFVRTKTRIGGMKNILSHPMMNSQVASLLGTKLWWFVLTGIGIHERSRFFAQFSSEWRLMMSSSLFEWTLAIEIGEYRPATSAFSESWLVSCECWCRHVGETLAEPERLSEVRKVKVGLIISTSEGNVALGNNSRSLGVSCVSRYVLTPWSNVEERRGKVK